MTLLHIEFHIVSLNEGVKHMDMLRNGMNMLGNLFTGAQQPAVPQPKPMPAKKAGIGAIPDVNIPMEKSPSSMMNHFMKMLMGQVRTNLQSEFMANQARVNTEEDELNPEKSKSFLPTIGRAVKNAMPTLLGGFMSLLANLLNSLLGLFGVKKSTQDAVATGLKTVGKGLFSENPGEGLKNIAENAAPAMMTALNDAFKLGLPTDVMQAATATPVSKPKPVFTPSAPQQQAGIFSSVVNGIGNLANNTLGAINNTLFGQPEPQRRSRNGFMGDWW